MGEEELNPFQILFLGTPDFAAVILDKLLQWSGARVAGVMTQPDRRAGRGKTIHPPPVKQLALDAHLPLLQPHSLDSSAVGAFVEDIQANLLVVAAYGLLIPTPILSCPAFGALNVHASLLPKYRGAAPIQRALIHGETVTGITIMQMQAGLDTGPILYQKALAIGFDETAQSLHDQLASLGGDCLIHTLQNWDSLRPIQQDPAKAGYAPKLRKQDGHIDWNQTAQAVHNLIRGVHPRPGAFFFWRPGIDREALRLSVFPGRIGERIAQAVPPGQICGLHGSYLAISCLDRYYLVETLQPAAGRAMSASEFYRGYCSVASQRTS